MTDRKEKFTPGPWIMEGDRVVTENATCAPDRVFGYASTNNFICDLDDGEYHQYSDTVELEANARLIAAAPEMYEMLEKMHVELRRVTFSNFSDAGKAANWIADIERLLKKARGEE